MNSKRDFIEQAMRYHKIVLLIVAMLVIIGVCGLILMPKQEMPEITVRQGLVVAVYPGATSSEIEEKVTKPLENFIFEYKEVNKKKTYSQSKDGMVIVFVELNDNVDDKDVFWSRFKHGLAAFKAQLPAGVLALQAQDDFGDTSSILITLSSKQKTYHELDTYLSNLEDMLRKIDAVSRLRREGTINEQITVYLDHDKMAQYRISSYSLLQKLSAKGFTPVSGSVKNSTLVAPIHITDNLDSESSVGEQIIYSDPQGNIIRLKDVARIVREYPDADKYIKSGDAKCVLLSVEMRSGYDIVAMGNEVHELLDKYSTTLPDDVKINIITDQSKVVSDSVINFLRELLIAVISVIVVVILLMPLRVAGVSAISIPITIFISISLFYILGIELNTVTLAALIVTLGMVVDDSVVIIDNYVEKLGQGMSRWHAAIAAPREFFMSVLSATLSISMIFFPFLFTMKGTLHDFVKSFPWAMFIILSISLTVSLLLTPYLQYIFIKKGIVPASEKKGKKSPLDYLQDGYNWLLTKCFKYPYATIGVGLASIAAGLLIFATIPQRLMPIADRNQFAVEFYLPAGTAVERTASVADSMRLILEKDPRVTSITTFLGQGSPRFHATYAPQVGGSNFAQFIVNTKSIEATEELLDEYSDRYADYFPDVYLRFKQMDYSDATYPVEIRLSGDSINALKEAASIVMRQMKENPDLKLVRTNYEEPLPGVLVMPDEIETNRLGISNTLLSADLALHFGNGIPVATIWEGDYPVGVTLKSDRPGEQNFGELPNDYVEAMGGAVAVPLRQVAKIKPDWNEGSIVRRNGVRTISVVAEATRGGNENDISKAAFKSIDQSKLPEGVTMSMGGISERDSETLPKVVGAVAVAIVIIFFILLFHFKRISLAAINLSSISLCLLGAALGLKIVGVDLSITAILGIVSLMGILVRNGIIMLDYAEELRRGEGMSVRDAAYHSGVRRLRPIFLTSAAASVGVIPMILEHSSLWTPMGAVIFFGVLVSMVFISTVLPVAYYLLFNKKSASK